MYPLRTNIYIDGFNLYYGKLKGIPFKWINLDILCRNNLDPAKNKIQKIKYFTALVKPHPGDPEQNIRQQAYIRALSTLPNVEIIYGHFLTHEVNMPLAQYAHFIRKIQTGTLKKNLFSDQLLDANGTITKPDKW